ncbi:MAG: hypothetical protein ACE5H7_15780 [Acidiferrobacterales bacterium]
MFAWLSSFIGRTLAVYLSKPIKNYESFSAYDAETLTSILEPGDILLVDGNLRFSAAVKYLAQSTWSHAAMFVGDVLKEPAEDGRHGQLIEAALLKLACIAAGTRAQIFGLHLYGHSASILS